MKIIGYILGYLLVGIQILAILAGLAIVYAVGRMIWKLSDEEKKGNVNTHDGWKDGTWYGGSDSGD